MMLTKNGENYDLKLELTQKEFDLLLVLAGMATGLAFKNGMTKLAYSFLDLANRINEGNPNYHPYEIPEEYRPQ